MFVNAFMYKTDVHLLKYLVELRSIATPFLLSYYILIHSQV